MTVFGGFCLLGFLHVLYDRQLPMSLTLLSLALMLALFALQMLHLGRHEPKLRRSSLGYLVLLGQALIVYPPMLIYGAAWISLPGFLGGWALLVLSPAWGWTILGLVAVSVGCIQAVTLSPGEPPVISIAYAIISTIITGLIIYGLTRLASVVTAMHAARTEMAKLAVAAERLRFARDLHDLLGYSLSAISLKSELTHRLVTKNPGRAEEELAQILEISRQALADVRSVASGYRELSFDDEAKSARSVLSAADVDVRMELLHRELPPRVRTVLATVLREGVTNILRHSKAERCDITLRQTDSDVTIEIVNDGVPPGPRESLLDSGSGIHNLSNRVANLDGSLTTSTSPDGFFRLRATIPTGREESELASTTP
jgi:two-component system sensor histidine kinase DesK